MQLHADESGDLNPTGSLQVQVSWSCCPRPDLIAMQLDERTFPCKYSINATLIYVQQKQTPKVKGSDRAGEKGGWIWAVSTSYCLFLVTTWVKKIDTNRYPTYVQLDLASATWFYIFKFGIDQLCSSSPGEMPGKWSGFLTFFWWLIMTDSLAFDWFCIPTYVHTQYWII